MKVALCISAFMFAPLVASADGLPAPRLGTTFNSRMATNELGAAALSRPAQPWYWAFVDNGHGGWALDGSTFDEKGIALYSYTGRTWGADLTGNSSAETASTWAMSVRARIGDAADQVIWFLRYSDSEGVGVYLRTVATSPGRIGLSLEWSGNASYLPYENVILEEVDTTNYHHYVVTSSTSVELKLFVDGVQRWSGSRVRCYKNAEGEVQDRNISAKSFNSLWLGCVNQKTNVGAGAWTTLYDDVRFYATNETTDDSVVPTASQIAQLTEMLSEDRVLPVPSARLMVTFDDRTLSDSAGVITQEGEDSGMPLRTFSARDGGGYSLNSGRLSPGSGACLYQHATWADDQPLLGGAREDAHAFAVSLVARLAPVDGAAVCFLRYGGNGVGDVLYTVTNETGGTDLAITWLAASNSYAYANILARNIDTQNYHHYVLVCSKSSNTRPIRLYIDTCPVDLFTGTRMTHYKTAGSKEETNTRAAASKGFSGFYLAAARGAEFDCISPTSTMYGDVRLFSGENTQDEFGPCAIDILGVEALYRSLMPYRDAPQSGMRLIFR